LNNVLAKQQQGGVAGNNGGFQGAAWAGTEHESLDVRSQRKCSLTCHAES
jgi:hypothetical protein